MRRLVQISPSPPLWDPPKLSKGLSDMTADQHVDRAHRYEVEV